MEPRQKTIEQWFSVIETGGMKLPRFQRGEAWRHNQIVGLFENVLRKPPLPVGTLLTLDVGSRERFKSRPIVGAPDKGEKPNLHLLDGQQRMTALWRALTDDYDDLTIFVSLRDREEDEEADDDVRAADQPALQKVRRWDRKGVRQPRWADDPKDCFERGLIPLRHFRPGAEGEAALKAWFDTLREADAGADPFIGRAYELRSRLSSYIIPFLSLGADTSRATALDVFIKMNTSASPLKDFDIVTAQMEDAGHSLHDMISELKAAQPAATEFGRIEDIVLSVGALVSGQPPLKKTYLDPLFSKGLGDNWPLVMNGVRRGLDFVQNEGIYGEKCLPGETGVYLACALWADVPDHGLDQEGNARSLIRKVLWRAFYTERYGKTSATRSFADYKVLRGMVAGESEGECELFDGSTYPLPTVEEIELAGWPGRKDRLPRATLATALRKGGDDFADGAPASTANVRSREYHHIYPVDVLGGDRKDERVARAMNCALITWRTNRNIAAKTPEAYIKARAEAASLGKDEVRSRLASHLIPYESLVAGDYEVFLRERAKLIHSRMTLLCAGKNP